MNINILLTKNSVDMKKLFFIALVLLITGAVYGQRVVGDAHMMPKQNHSITKGLDTLLPGNWANATQFANYGITGAPGYVVGVNGYGDISKAQAFIVMDPYSIEGVMIWFGAKDVVSPDGMLNITVWSMDGTTGTTASSTGATEQCPGSILTTDAVSMANIDTSSSSSGAHIHMFTTSAWVSYDYAVGIDMTDVKMDTISIVSSADGEGGGMELTWEQWSDLAWYTMMYAWSGIDFDLGIFPIVDITSGTVENGSFINGIKLQSYPNPAVNNVKVSYEIADAAKVALEIYSMSGQLVKRVDAGQQAAGIHNMEINVSDLSKGTYVYSLVAGNNRLTKRMIIE